MSNVQESIVVEGDKDQHKLPYFQVMETTTQLDYEEFIFRWNLKLPANMECLNHTFESPVFIGGKQSQHSWQLKWMRHYNESEKTFSDNCNVFLSLLDVNVGEGRYFHNRKYSIKAHARISLTKLEESELLKNKTEHENLSLEVVKTGETWKTLEVKATDFWNEAKGYIVNNVFTVCCRILMGCVSNSNKTSQLLSVISGESYACFNNENISRSIAESTKQALCALDFTDVELVADTKSFSAHKVVLAANSPVFSAMFRTNMQEVKDNSVNIQDFGAESVEAMLEFIYTGKILKFPKTTSYSYAAELFQIADKYQIMKLRAQCEVFLCSKINVKHAIEILELASLYSCSMLKSTVLQFILSNKTEVSETNSFKKLTNPLIWKELFLFD